QASDGCLADGCRANSGAGVIERRRISLPLPWGDGKASVAHPSVQSISPVSRAATETVALPFSIASFQLGGVFIEIQALQLSQQARIVGQGFFAFAPEEDRKPREQRKPLQGDEPRLLNQRRANLRECSESRFDVDDVRL